MPDPKPRKRVLGVQIGDKGAGGSIRPLMKPRNHAVSYRWRELEVRLCVRYGHLGRSCAAREGGVCLVGRGALVVSGVGARPGSVCVAGRGI